ncbi:11186_t:CDS:1 [Diversispora eburnea]|uniref:11186_t:CDS:1 n=1 Tax=Diversispora eburnea TaxID=1213867 RepID=A0A9N8ZIR1_9GLOM|nr:11186_t:CDS:1 [Diversispora eburnea]
MATKISQELLVMILNNVKSIHDLYSSLLVNRTWCKITIPILWELAFDQEFNWMNYNKCRRRALCVRTYISCMDNQSRTLLTQSGFDLSSSPPQVTFNYPSFTREFRIDNLAHFISIYSQKIIGSYQDNYDNNNNKHIIIAKSRILFLEICKLIINRCTFLDSFKMTKVPKIFFENFLNSDLICSIFTLPGAAKVFKKFRTFVLETINDEPISLLYESLALICNNILNMDLEFRSDSQMEVLGKLICVQKRLENLSIIGVSYLNFNLLLWNIISQKEILKSLRLKSVSFYNFKGKLPIGQFTSLQELYIENCHELYSSECLSLASSFTQLSSFHFFYQCNKLPQKFIIKILETANTNLKNIYLDCLTIPSDTFSAILIYCTKITELTLLDLSLEQVIAIFNNNFNELKRFSFHCGIGLDANELLRKMVESVPESLEIIEIRMGIFNADSLRKFFKGWCSKEGGRNKKMIVNRQEQLFTLSNEHFKVIEEYGVQFNIK